MLAALPTLVFNAARLASRIATICLASERAEDVLAFKSVPHLSCIVSGLR